MKKHFTVENLIFSFSVCRGHLVLFFPKNYVFLNCESKSFRRRPKTNWACFWKCIKIVQKNVLVVFSPKNLINHLETRTNFPRNLKEKYLALISKVQNTCAKEKIDNFLPKKRFFNLVLQPGNFQNLSENLQQNFLSSFFVSRSSIGTFFQKYRHFFGLWA